jgi:hypothetical protein
MLSLVTEIAFVAAKAPVRATLNDISLAPQALRTMRKYHAKLTQCAGTCALRLETRARAKLGASIEPKEEQKVAVT